jgi:hypothetical protein
MIETKETILEYWLGMRLERHGYQPEARTRNSLDKWFIEKGYKPMHRAYSEHFSEYYNDNDGNAIIVDDIDYFDDALISNEQWALIWSRERCQYFIVPYGALRDIGIHWGYREITYTDKDNSTEKDLQQTLETLIDLTLAYEI